MMRGWKLCIATIAGLFLAGCQQELYRGLSQRDSIDVVALLSKRGIAATREAVDASTYKISVDETQISLATEVLRAAGYPRETYKSLGEIFPGDGLIVSPYEQRIRMMYAMDQELGRTISGIEGVIRARVHVVVPELDLRGKPVAKPSAAVVLHHLPGIDTFNLALKVRMIVAHAVQGLETRDVAVSLFPIDSLDTGLQTSSLGNGSEKDSLTSASDSGSNLASFLWAGAFATGLAGFLTLRRKQADGKA